ncbi:type IV secretory pathway VirB11 ATPase [Sphingopyxis fribergensis]|uniref:Type IV secretion system protein n=1 Tax=Sphingopyxis fribergensis TaxID=1515612 RepID=A0A0A7PFZ6_9SPHN|nr:P-type DNA transfer ATPase VirB11 [Sphingopyxis fribergensis]AJA08930.1 type IV secretory pathway VirB11 ATPase [Sphingopyxis fribergensis]
MTAAVADRVYLGSYLAPLSFALDRADVTDIYINRPGELWIETLGGAIERHDVPTLDAALLARLARQVAALSHQGISREHPLLSASLPDGSRIQVVAPPATRGDLAIAIRKHVSAELTLDDYVAADAFRAVRKAGKGQAATVERVRALVDSGDVAAALRAAVRGRLNVLISGGTSSGKTTFLNALIREIPPEERLVVIEDTPEIRLAHANAVGLIAARSALGEASVTANDLVSASLRMRPDRIILGELRGVEAFAFLRAINTGHPGSMTTIHADSVERAFEQLALLVLEGGSTLQRADILSYVRTTVDVVLQLSRDASGRHVSGISVGGQ